MLAYIRSTTRARLQLALEIDSGDDVTADSSDEVVPKDKEHLIVGLNKYGSFVVACPADNKSSAAIELSKCAKLASLFLVIRSKRRDTTRET